MRSERQAAQVDSTAVAEETDLIEALRGGDERAFRALVERFHASMVRLARMYVPSSADAEEVAQEAWLGVLRGLDRFEGRSSLKTWLFRIVKNRAMNRGTRERRSVPFSTLLDPDGGEAEPSVDPSRFQGPGGDYPGHWSRSPAPWEDPERLLVSGETFALIGDVIAALPPAQRQVITLRDVDGVGSAEVCELFGLSEGNQRVLLHRARTRVRAALERYVTGDTL